MDFIDKVKQSWETLVKPYPINTANLSRNHLPKKIRPNEELSEFTPESPPYLDELIADVSPLPPYSIIIGGCDDRSHLYMDLSDPAPGSILIAGDDCSGRSRLLDSILFSSVRLNTPRRVRYAVIAPDISGLEYLTLHPHCYKACTTASGEAMDLIYELAETADFRRNNPHTGSAIILAIDDLACLLTSMDAAIIEQLRWLIQVGPEVQIWTVATINSNDVTRIDPNFINHFGTRLIGYIKSQEVVDILNGSLDSKPQDVIAGSQFNVFFEKAWLKIWIPAVEEVVL